MSAPLESFLLAGLSRRRTSFRPPYPPEADFASLPPEADLRQQRPYKTGATGRAGRFAQYGQAGWYHEILTTRGLKPALHIEALDAIHI